MVLLAIRGHRASNMRSRISLILARRLLLERLSHEQAEIRMIPVVT